MPRLDGKVIIVTGAGSGMGRAMANLFAGEGAKVVAAEWHPATLDEVVNEVKAAGGEITGAGGDVSKPEDCERIVGTALDAYGKLDVLCNNAGVMDDFAAAADVTDAGLLKVMGVNAFGPFYMIRAALPQMLSAGGGSIVNTASMAGVGGGSAGCAYTMSKHAVIGLTKNTAWEYAKQGIRCNAMAVGAVQTNIMANAGVQPNQSGMGRAMEFAGLAPALLEPMDVANLALFLASDESAKVNGAVINVDGGWGAV